MSGIKYCQEVLPVLYAASLISIQSSQLHFLFFHFFKEISKGLLGILKLKCIKFDPLIGWKHPATVTTVQLWQIQLVYYKTVCPITFKLLPYIFNGNARMKYLEIVILFSTNNLRHNQQTAVAQVNAVFEHRQTEKQERSQGEEGGRIFKFM